MRTALTASHMPADIGASEVQSMLEHMLASEEFARAQRMSRLLRFLVESRISETASVVNEYTIGLRVFDRHPANYHPGEDPIVRVQVGRLRERLRAYYAAAGGRAGLLLSIPLGSYVLDIRRLGGAGVPSQAPLALLPLAGLGEGDGMAAFARGLDEQLAHQLFRVFGSRVIAPARMAAPPPASGHWIEGSVRAEGEQLRLAVRLVDAQANRMLWCAQFDRAAPWSMRLQEELADAVCAGVQAALP